MTGPCKTARTDTVAAIVTAPGEAGIAIVRISGCDAFAIADRLFSGVTPPSAMPPRRFQLGPIRDPKDASAPPIDEVLLLKFAAPHSYTGEDVIELQGHGGRTAARRLLQLVLDAGARHAGPGEFTRRAFLNGRIDLTQAEAVCDLIRARSDRAAAMAVLQLEGMLSDSIVNIYDSLLITASDLEATLDFAEDEVPKSVTLDVALRLRAAISAIDALLATWNQGHLLRDGARIAILGEPNVGKSTLMNRLLGRDRSIVTAVPGTTRDTIEETVVIEGYPVNLIDTAGLRDTDCIVEKEGVRRAEDIIRGADIRLHVIDGSRALGPADVRLLEQPDSSRLVLLNKADLVCRVPLDALPEGTPVLQVCLIRGDDVPAIRNAILEKLEADRSATSSAAISVRHREALTSAVHDIRDAVLQVETNCADGGVIAAQDLRSALESLGTITGRSYSEELLDTIFSRFCIGK
jgi:tRNA modification GTPase